MSTEKTIQDAVIAVLAGDIPSLAIDSRTVAVQPYFPEQAHKASRLPMVVVERPTLVAKDAWDTGSEREEHAAQVLLVDQCKPSADGFEECVERLDLLRRKVEARLRARPYLGLAGISVMPGTWKLDRVPGDPQNEGNNLMVIPWRLTVAVIVPN